MPLLTLRKIKLGFGGPLLLDGVDLQIEPGERVCLVGRNGTGKSTLLHILSGELIPDEGDVVRSEGLVVARLGQEVPMGVDSDVFDVVAGGLGAQGALLTEYHEVSHRLAASGGEALLQRLQSVQERLEAEGGWQLNQRVETALSKLSLDGDAAFGELSGGLKRRVMLARALVTEPDLLLLDEPTNHLDIDAIRWLEEFLSGFSGALLFITHDRAFLQRLATRIVELDRGQLTSWPGDYATYLRRKSEALEAEARQQANFDKKLAREEAWIRQGIKARRTRNEGRVRGLQELRKERQGRRERVGTARIQLDDAERSGKIVTEVENVSHGYQGHTLIRDFTTTIFRGDRIGLIGPNGVGKTTLLKILLGELQPDQGQVKPGTRLEVAYFDQYRAQLDETATVIDNVGEGRDMVTVGGQSRHVMSYLQDFLFAPQRCRSPVSTLSGGERNRLLLAKLFLKPANVLVMDEPTNDLDVETLELLEERLYEFSGTLLLVSHDRAFLDNVVTSTLVFEGDGRIGEYVGGYEEWLRQRKTPKRVEKRPAPTAKPHPAGQEKTDSRKLSYKEQRQLDALPQRIEELEGQIDAIHHEMADPDFYRAPNQHIAETKARLEALEDELSDAYRQWESLESA
ncbi:ATP-binding cassette ATPase Uup [Thiohalomonas denitrificans]|uniref:ATP-binding protein Uup n=1 Tax=Thiohalomonas denitrificans TaxID=415747 RepID=A0A1G5PKS1_9GAMM|nr:ATP-binding cassette domain-containing protein [Thiohalomonas denitrificans]SCZ50048.1 ATP-binding cassette, subfamily F, uup [Thiohalomonas denitrificans]